MNGPVIASLRRLSQRGAFWPLAMLALLLLVNLFADAHFFSITVRDGHLYGSLIDILKNASPMMIIAMGLTLVIATHGIDISVGAVVAISGAVAAALIGGQLVMDGGAGMQDVTQMPLPLVVLCSLAVALALGAWNGALITMVGMQPIIATLILLVMGRGVAQLITEGQIITIYYSPYHVIGSGFFLGIPVSLYIAAGVGAVLWFLARRTALGMFVEAIGINPVAARLAGIRARAITLTCYAVCSLCAGIAGLIVSSNVKSADGNNAGLLFELDAILAVVLGGTSLSGGRFHLMGSVIGVLIIQTLTTTIYAVGVPPEINLVVKAVFVLAVSVLQSDKVRRLIGLRVRRGAAP